MRLISILLFSLISFFNVVLADEGMLIPLVLKAFESDMQARGMKLSAEDIYSINQASLKDAIFQFGGGCTAELVSSQGLLLTNHHCGYSQIQSHSSLEHDYLKNGFWAKNNGEELANPGLTATRIVRIEDVTDLVLAGVSGKTDQTLIATNISALVKKAIEGTHYEAEIKAFDYGNSYYLMVKEVFKDIRFVGTPPNSIGKFGGDTDNWVWPRHTGDFSVFRIYAGKDNKPADYSIDNVPYKPLKYLNISFKDRKEGDFTMVYGFPGVTEQHVVSEYLKFIIEQERPARIEMRDNSLAIIDDGMKSSDLIRIQYAAKQASIANAWKKWIGQVEGLKNLDAVNLKMQYEDKYRQKTKENTKWKKYADALDSLNSKISRQSKNEFRYAMGIEYFIYGPEYFKLIKATNDFLATIGTATAEQKASEKAKLLSKARGFYKNYTPNIDQSIFEKLTTLYKTHEFKNNDSWNAVNIATLTEAIYSKSIFTDSTRFLNWIQKANLKSVKKIENDPGYKHYMMFYPVFAKTIVPAFQAYQTAVNQLMQVYVEGKYVMFPEDKHWPDANSTLRITYGQLEGSSPVDGMAYTEHTTLDGILAKNRTGNPDFELLPRMFELAASKSYGPYAQDGELWVCFTGSNHTTGGNSGSPVLDEHGNLMGLNFDRSWESTMSDYLFDPNRCRNIVVDIRYVLWVMDIYSGAKHLVDEMTLIKD
ncbi:MAG: S46 family peptidase [Chitinophagaceae bacterium]